MIPGFHGFDLVIILLVFLVANGSWVWALVDCIINKRLEQERKILWVLVIIFTHFIGALLYFIFGRPKKPKPLPQDENVEEVGRYYGVREEQQQQM